MCTNIGLAAMISVDKSNNKFYAKPTSNFADDFVDNFVNSFGSDSDFSSVSSKSGFKTMPTPLP